MLILSEPSVTFTVTAPNKVLTPVILGNFSAPVKVDNALDTLSLLTIFKHAKDPFNRWDAMQTLYDRCIQQLESSPGSAISNDIWDRIKEAIAQERSNVELLGECLVIPSFETLCQTRNNVKVDALVSARNAFCRQFSIALEQELLNVFNGIESVEYCYAQSAVNERRCKNVVLAHLARLPQYESLVLTHFENADNMTDTLGALKSAQYCDKSTFDKLMAAFESKWNHDPLVLDKWFALHATQSSDDIFATITMLCEHPQFTMSNPNRVRAVMGSFAFYNSEKFHALDGSGYKFVTDYLLKLDGVNPQVASRIVTPLTQWQRFATEHQVLMKQQLGRLLNHKGLSKDVFEKVSKSLAYDKH